MIGNPVVALNCPIWELPLTAAVHHFCLNLWIMQHLAQRTKWSLDQHGDSMETKEPIDSIDFDRFEYQSSVFRAANGPILTHAIRPLASARYKSRQIFVDLPDGGRRPFCDPKDVVYMMWTSPALALCLLMLNWTSSRGCGFRMF